MNYVKMTDEFTAQLHPFTMRQIIEATCEVLNVLIVDFLSNRRIPDAVRARHIAWWIARTRTCLTLSAIGKFSGGKHHTTIMYSCNMIAAFHSHYIEDIKAVEKKLGL